MPKLLFAALLFSTAASVSAQSRVDGVHRVDPGQMYHRVYARMPVTGAGTRTDPFRPLLLPAPTLTSSAAVTANNHTGILSYTVVLSDDGKWALVEFVGQSPKELLSITSAAATNIVIFERGKATIAEIEADFQQYKKGFTIAGFASSTGRPQ